MDRMDYREWQEKHPNFMTPELLKYKTIGNYVVELSKGTGIRNEPMYGVSLLEREDGGFSSYIGLEMEVSKPFFDSDEAENYFTNLAESVRICQPFEKDTFRNCVKRELEKLEGG